MSIVTQTAASRPVAADRPRAGRTPARWAWPALVLAACAAACAAEDGPYMKAAPPPGDEFTLKDAPGYCLWIPTGVTFVRGLIAVSGHETAKGIYNDDYNGKIGLLAIQCG